MKKAAEEPRDDRILISRSEAARLLCCSKMTVIRLEWDGKLTQVRLRKGRSSVAMYRASQVRALASIDDDAAA